MDHAITVGDLLKVLVVTLTVCGFLVAFAPRGRR